MNGERLFESILEISASELNINIQQKALEVITANEKNKGEKYVMDNFIWSKDMEKTAKKLKEISKTLNGRVVDKLARHLARMK